MAVWGMITQPGSRRSRIQPQTPHRKIEGMRAPPSRRTAIEYPVGIGLLGTQTSSTTGITTALRPDSSRVTEFTAPLIRRRACA